jgi:hypothetical protein
MNLRRLCFQTTYDESIVWPKSDPYNKLIAGNDMMKDLIHFYIQARGERWEESFATAVRLMRRHDGGSALRTLYEISIELARRMRVINNIRRGTKATFDGIIHTVEIYNGSFDSTGGRTIHPVRMWYTKDFMKDIAIKINLYPWIPEIPVIPIEYTGYHTNPKMYGKPETNKWFVKNKINK